VLFYTVLQDIQKRTALFDGSQASPAFPSDNSSIKIKIVMGHLWYDPNREPKYSEKNLSSLCHPQISHALAWLLTWDSTVSISSSLCLTKKKSASIGEACVQKN
jgi:hypothetical protein